MNNNIYSLCKKITGLLGEKKPAFVHPLHRMIYFSVLKAEFWFYKNKTLKTTGVKTYRNLYASPVNASGKAFLSKIIEKFGHEHFDYLIFVYDQTRFDEEIFAKCRFIYEKGLKWYFMKKYLLPDYCERYDYLFLWDDDLDVADFSYRNFLSIMERNNLEIAQPSLAPGSYYFNEILLKDDKCPVGRLTDIVENMAQVFSRVAWAKYWNMLEGDRHFWGWGHTLMAKSMCGYKKMGIVDCESVIHTRPRLNENHPTQIQAADELKVFMKEHSKKYHPSMMMSYGKLQ